MVKLEIVDGWVTLRFQQPYDAANDEAAYLAALEDFADVPGPYVLLTIFGGGPGLSQPGDKVQALWYKRTRDDLNARCKALAMVRPGASEEMARVFGKLWSFPVMATTDEAEARAFLAPYADKEKNA